MGMQSKITNSELGTVAHTPKFPDDMCNKWTYAATQGDNSYEIVGEGCLGATFCPQCYPCICEDVYTVRQTSGATAWGNTGGRHDYGDYDNHVALQMPAQESMTESFVQTKRY